MWAKLRDNLGGPARMQVVITFACVLGLDGADKGAIGAMAQPLQRAFGIGRTDLGLLLTASVSTTALATFVFGHLVDRAGRIRLLTWAVWAWACVMVLSGLATSYDFLLFSRVLLGAAAAAAPPAVASLVGDFFDPGERGSIYSTILSGEFIGSGIGFMLSGELASWTWRAGFIALAVPAVFLAHAVNRLKEPARGGSGRLAWQGGTRRERRDRTAAERDTDMRTLTERADVQPRERLVLHGEAGERSLWWAVRYVLRIPTNRILIVSSAIGYFYLTGLRTFGVEYLSEWFHVGHAIAVVLLIAAGAGALAGVLISGRLADHRLRQGHLRARITVAVIAFCAGAVLFVPALESRTLWMGLPLVALASLGLGAVNPPLDAARLDIMPAGLWGRAESVRTFLQKCGEAAAPVLFGYAADQIFGGGASGLHDTLLVMLIPLGGAGVLAWLARWTYLRDVATAQASDRKP